MAAKPPLPPSYADMMLGRLAKWLRLVGGDVAFSHDIDDDDLLRVAVQEGRLVLTRDRGIMARESPVSRFFIEHDRIGDQVRQIAGAFDLSTLEPFSRCLRCNVPILTVSKDLVRDRLWPYTYRTQDRIYECPSCMRLYWEGTHKARALRDLARMLGDHMPDRWKTGSG